MKLPIFYTEEPIADTVLLNEETSRHISGVLRMSNGDQLALTDGKGKLFTTEIVSDHKKKCFVKVLASTFQPPLHTPCTIAISLLKNTGRFEWFLEKATELGIAVIIPLICSRTEKQSFRIERMKQICISAMLQSQQVYLPLLKEPTPFQEFIPGDVNHDRFIAHCTNGPRKTFSTVLDHSSSSTLLIGPEGDFTEEEIEVASRHHFIPVSLGSNRLRSETAGMVGAVWLTSK